MVFEVNLFIKSNIVGSCNMFEVLTSFLEFTLHLSQAGQSYQSVQFYI